MNATEQAERRGCPRTQARLELVFSRLRGSPIRATTLDVSAHGLRASTTRPLVVDEVLSFRLTLYAADPIEVDPREVTGQARVMREHPNMVYGLRFEDVREEMSDDLASFVAEQHPVSHGSQ